MSDSPIGNFKKKKVFSNTYSAEEFINANNLKEYFIGPYSEHGDVAVYYKDDQTDPVNHPSHYETGGIECFDAIVASQGTEAAKDFCLCNAFKYIWRCKHKGKSLEDVEKAIWYLNKYVDFYCEELDDNES